MRVSARAELAGLALEDPAGQRQPDQAQTTYSPKFIQDLCLREAVVSLVEELSNTLTHTWCGYPAEGEREQTRQLR